MCIRDRERIVAEVFDGRPNSDHGLEHCAGVALRRKRAGKECSKVVFCVGRKATGDMHVPMGAITWAALVYPPDDSPERPQRSALEMIFDDSEEREREVRGSWFGFGCLAFPGFNSPSWSLGRLCLLAPDRAPPPLPPTRKAGEGGAQSDDAAEEYDEDEGDTFAFAWDRNQNATVLKWLPAQNDVQAMRPPFAISAPPVMVAPR